MKKAGKSRGPLTSDFTESAEACLGSIGNIIRSLYFSVRISSIVVLSCQPSVMGWLGVVSLAMVMEVQILARVLC